MLDPSCGSGTFLFTAIRMLREAGLKGKALTDYCTTHLAGIDVHPLAVLIAKANVLLALGDEWHGHPSALRLPVYMADTLSSEQPALEENVIPSPSMWIPWRRAPARRKRATWRPLSTCLWSWPTGPRSCGKRSPP